MKTITKSSECLKCKECCKFEKSELYFSPLFTAKEKEDVKEKVNFLAYKNSKNVFQLEMVKSQKEKGIYVCPLLEEGKHLCKIYENRPFDCRIWPFMLAKVEGKIHLVCFDKSLCQDIEKMPAKEFDDYKKYIINLLKTDKYKNLIKTHPELIWDYDPDTFFIAEMIELIA